MVISPDGESLLTGHTDGSAVLWNVKGVQLQRLEDPRPYGQSQVVQVAFDPSGSSIVVGHEDGTVRRWSMAGRLLIEIDTGTEALKTLAITASGDVWVAGHGGAGRWDSQGRQQVKLRGDGFSFDYLHLLPESTAIVLVGSQYGDNFLEMRDIQGRVLLTFQRYAEFGLPGGSLPNGPTAVSPDSRMLVVADWNRLHRWELPTDSP